VTAIPEDERLFTRLVELLGVKKPHRLTLQPMWQWMALLTETSFTLHILPGSPGLYERRGVRA
jgi:hypothetical protein